MRFLIPFLMSWTVFGASFPLSSGGSSTVRIVTVASPSTYLSTCATELSNHIFQATGAALVITNDTGSYGTSPLILVGSNAYTAALGYNTATLPWEGAYLDVLTNRVVLLGKDSGSGDNGTQYATYTFLKDYVGCRWYFPGTLGVVVPSNPTLDIATTNRTIEPWMSPRLTPGVMGSGFPVTSTELKTWGKRNRNGGADIVMGHTFYLLLPEDPWVSSNPEYYALKPDGVTRWLFNVPDPIFVQLDLSNHVALASIITNQARAFFDASPTNRYFTVMPGDSFGVYKCNCGYCLALYDDNTPGIESEERHTRYVFGFVNEVAGLLKADYPDRFISCNGYGSYRWPYPTNIVMETNVVIPITFNQVGFGYQLGDAMVDVSKWTNKMANRLFVDENYYAGVVAGGSVTAWEGAPRTCPHRIASEVGQRKNWIQGAPYDVYTPKVSGLTVYPMWLIDSLNVYVMSELDWDPNQDVDDLIQSYCDDLFGPASEKMKEWLDAVEWRWTAMPSIMGITYYQQPTEEWTTLDVSLAKCWWQVYPPSVLSSMRAILDEAEALTSGDELSRVQLWKEQCQDYIEQKAATGRRTGVAHGPRITTGKLTVQ